jgi:hypothetical protein
MRQLELPQRRSLPSRWALIVLLSCVLASMFIAFRAGAQNSAPKPDAAKTATPAEEKPGTSKPIPAKPGQKLESSATIQDDETIVPDPKESADNNITFPVDI